MKRTEYLRDSLLDQRPAKSLMPSDMPPDCFGKFDEPEAIVRHPTSDIVEGTQLFEMYGWYAKEATEKQGKTSTARPMEEQAEAMAQSKQADDRLADFIDFHREYRLARWNAKSIGQSLWYAKDVITERKSGPQSTVHIQDVVEYHLEWAISTGL
ncbi:hypothetical protein EXS54_00935 [Patescibacteria group bacterium]|nr:hypothetical protein [Patescibacteria group bacterium]